jgi:uncharacterized membrane protein YdjX (TVP38/TMEM64 family)
MSDEIPERRGSSLRRLLPLALLVAATAAFFAFGGERYLTFSALSRERAALADLTARLGLLAPLVYVLAYTAVAALSVPGAAALTIASGFLFGTALGALYTVVGATAGATLLFLAARAGLGGLLARAGPAARRFEAGFRKNAFNYLLVLRLIPIFPFWLINLAAALTGMGVRTFVLATFLGIIPGTLIYASLGNGLETLAAAGKAPGLEVLFRANILLPLIGIALLALAVPLYRWWRERSSRP